MTDRPANYRITARGTMPEGWRDRFGGMTVSAGDPATITLEGWLPDQAALVGVLDALFELHLPIVQVLNLGDGHPVTHPEAGTAALSTSDSDNDWRLGD